MSEWENIKISNLIDFNPKRPLKKGTTAPFIDMASLPTNHKDILSIKQKKYSGNGSKFQNGDILFARITPCLENGKTALVSNLNEGEIGHGSTEFIVLSPKKHKSDSLYIYYLSRLPEFRKFAEKHLEGTSGRQRVSWQSLASFEFSIPDKVTRDNIGNFLFSLDQKIQLNNEINQTLEQIAQAIFKHWFIDFAPVHAKASALAEGKSLEEAQWQAMLSISGKTSEQLTALAENNPTAYQELQQTAAAFPSEFVESELGLVPKGWEVKKIKSLGRIVCGKTPSKALTTNFGNEIPFIKIPDMHNNTFVIQTNELLSNQGANSQPKKFIPKGSLCVSCIATVGIVSITSQLSQTNQQINTIIPSKDDYIEFLYLYFSRREMKDNLTTLASGGSATLNLNTKSFSNIDILFPCEKIIKKFKYKIENIFKMILSNQIQNRILHQTRDELLPKLLNGEIEL